MLNKLFKHPSIVLSLIWAITVTLIKMTGTNVDSDTQYLANLIFYGVLCLFSAIYGAAFLIIDSLR